MILTGSILLALCIFWFVADVPVVFQKPLQHDFHSNPHHPHGLHIFRNICTEVIKPGISFKQLVVYNSPQNTMKTIKVESGPSGEKKDHFWVIHFRKVQMPKEFTVRSSTTAFFVKLICAGNLYHFWTDVLKGLYGSILATSQHTKTKGYEVLHDISQDQSVDSSCGSINRYRDFLSALNVTLYSPFHSLAHGTCYSTAVFGYHSKNVKEGEVEGMILRHHGISKKSCKPLQTTIIKRGYRRMLNMVDLQAVSDNIVGTQSVSVVQFENLTLSQQMQISFCTKILIGVQGAGLAWYTFMKKPAALIEIGWEGWPAGRYVKRALGQGYYAAKIENCTVDNTVTNLYEGRKIRGNTRKAWHWENKIIDTSGSDTWRKNSNVRKFVDCRVDIKTFNETLLNMVKNILATV